MKRIAALLLLLALLAGAWHAGLLPTHWLPADTPANPAELYRWRDAQGRWLYGNSVPAGVQAEPLDARDRLSVVPATPIPAAPSKELPEGVSIQQLATERAIEQAAGTR